MTNPGYDPKKAHDYYEKHKHLIGRGGKQTEDLLKTAGSTGVRPRRPGEAMAKMVSPKQSAQMRVVRLTEKVHKLQDALNEAENALRLKRQTANAKPTAATKAKQKAASKKYRQTHKSQIAAAAKKAAASSGGGNTPVSQMSETDLVSRISKIKGAISNAKQQIQAANALAHSLSDSSFISHSGRSAVNTN